MRAKRLPPFPTKVAALAHREPAVVAEGLVLARLVACFLAVESRKLPLQLRARLGDGAGSYALVGPGWRGVLPAGITRAITTPTPVISVLARVAIVDDRPETFLAASRVQNDTTRPRRASTRGGAHTNSAPPRNYAHHVTRPPRKYTHTTYTSLRWTPELEPYVTKALPYWVNSPYLQQHGLTAEELAKEQGYLDRLRHCFLSALEDRERVHPLAGRMS